MLIINDKLIKNYLLKKNFDIYLSYKKSLLYIKGLYGFIVFKLPSFYFYKNEVNKLSLLFINKFFFLSFVKHFFVLYKRLFFIYNIRLRIRGLGYRIRKISDNLYYFFFNYTNMYYFYIPDNILIKWYKKRMILLSNDFFLLKLLFTHILLLKNLGPYRLRGLRYPRQVILIKKGGKKV